MKIESARTVRWGVGCAAVALVLVGCPAGRAAAQVPCTLTCPPNVTANTDPNQCGAVVNYTAPTPSDDCGSITCTPASGSFFPVGTTTVMCTDNGGSLVTGGAPAMCSFTITVWDTQPPTITCSANITTSNAPDQCGAVVNIAAPTASDNCPGVVVTLTPPSGSFFPVGKTTETGLATDAARNTATCASTVTVNDTQAPSISCPAEARQLADPTGQTPVDYPAPQASDNCPGVGTTCSPPAGSDFPNGTTEVMCRASDVTGNAATCDFDVFVEVTVPVVGGAGLALAVALLGGVGAWSVVRRRPPRSVKEHA